MTDDLILTSLTKPTLIEVMAPHCVECRAMQPDLDAVAEEFGNKVDLLVLDATERTSEAASLRVMGTPTLIAVNGGVEISRFTGRRSRSELRELFAAVAAGEADSVSKVTKSDKIVWTVAGALLAAIGFATGPSWIFVAMGIGLVGYANLRG